MVCAEQFLYAMLNGQDYTLLTSPNLDKLVSYEDLIFLCHIGDQEITERELKYWTTKWLSVSYIKPMKDQYGRRTIWNHTFVIPLGEYLALTEPQKYCRNHLITSLGDVPSKLKSVKLE